MVEQAIDSVKAVLRDLDTAPLRQLRGMLDGLLGGDWLAPGNDYLESTLLGWGMTVGDIDRLIPAMDQAQYDEGEELSAWFTEIMARPSQDDAGAESTIEQEWGQPRQSDAHDQGEGGPAGTHPTIQPVPGYPDWWARQDVTGDWVYLQSAQRPTLDTPGWLDQAAGYSRMTGESLGNADETGGYAGDTWDQRVLSADGPGGDA
jgi:hypothetical protein